MAAHREVACVAASAALYACALMVASTRQPDAVSPAGVTIAAPVYVSFAVIAIARWPPWLLAVVTIAGAVASMAAGTPDLLVGPALAAGMFVVSLRSERTPAIAGTAAVIGVLLAGHLGVQPAREDRVVRCGGGAVDRGGGRHRTGGPGQASARAGSPDQAAHHQHVAECDASALPGVPWLPDRAVRPDGQRRPRPHGHRCGASSAPGDAGLALVRSGTRIIVADSDRFTEAGASASLAVVDVPDALEGRPALPGYLPAGGFPRQMAVEQGGRTLLVTNFDSSQLESVNVADLP